MNRILSERRAPRRLLREQRGITGLETAIVLIAFVVVASVFAFAVLTTGILTAEKSRTVAIGGLQEAQSSLALRGGVLGITLFPTSTHLSSLQFEIRGGSGVAGSIDFSTSSMLVSYFDMDQAITFPGTAWTATWKVGTGPELGPGEIVQLDLTLDGQLTLDLGPSKLFTVELNPSDGAVLTLSRRTPPQLTSVVFLR